jgi:hypothetical protein
VRVITYTPRTTTTSVTPTAQPKNPPADPDGDTTERLAKYVPAETLAFYTPIAAIVAAFAQLQALILLVGIVGTFFYLRRSARSVPSGKKVLGHFYLLSCVAFVFWALATDHSLSASFIPDKVFEIPRDVVVGVVLAIVVYLLPGIDDELAARGI